MTRVCLIGTVLALLAIGIFVASPLRYGPRDVAVVPTTSVPSQNTGTLARVNASG
jgi:hypothetical protein